MEVMGIFSTNLGLMEDDGWNWLALLSLKRRPHVFISYKLDNLGRGMVGAKVAKGFEESRSTLACK